MENENLAAPSKTCRCAELLCILKQLFQLLIGNFVSSLRVFDVFFAIEFDFVAEVI
jgi:hypothetical protein